MSQVDKDVWVLLSLVLTGLNSQSVFLRISYRDGQNDSGGVTFVLVVNRSSQTFENYFILRYFIVLEIKTMYIHIINCLQVSQESSGKASFSPFRRWSVPSPAVASKLPN